MQAQATTLPLLCLINEFVSFVTSFPAPYFGHVHHTGSGYSWFQNCFAVFANSNLTFRILILMTYFSFCIASLLSAKVFFKQWIVIPAPQLR